MHSIETRKKALRGELRRAVLSAPEDHLSRWSADICKSIEAHPRFQQAQGVLLFFPLPDEPDIVPLLHRHAQCKRVFLPRVTGSTTMEACLLNREADLRTGAFHILEPQGTALTCCTSIDLVIVPGMAFDAEGFRLGRGRGYYDRFLSRPDMAQAYKIGVCFPIQYLTALPHEEWDARMDEVIVGQT